MMCFVLGMVDRPRGRPPPLGEFEEIAGLERQERFMVKDDRPENSDESLGDDLTLIKGIREPEQELLRERFDVHTFADLATLSVEKIEAALATAGMPTQDRAEIHAWIVQAGELAAASGLVEDPTLEVTASQIERGADPQTAPEWKPVAAFIVTFWGGGAGQYGTSAHQIEEESSETWRGIEVDGLCRWMLAQLPPEVHEALEDFEVVEELEEVKGEDDTPLGLEIAPAHRPEETMPEDEEDETPPAPKVVLPHPGEAPAVVEPAVARSEQGAQRVAQDVAVHVTGVRVRQPVGTAHPLSVDRPGQMLPGLIGSTEPCALEASFAVVGPDAEEVARQRVPYFCQFHVRDVATGVQVHLGDSMQETLREGQSAYTASLSSTYLRKGAYRLQVLVVLRGVRPVPGFFEVPMLRVS